MFLVSFHGSVNNLYAYDDGGSQLATDVLDPQGQALSELRGLYRDPASGLLYVANGGKATSNVLCFQGAGVKYDYLSTFVPAAAAGGPGSVIHPYGLAFDGAGGCYVSNQDSNVVAAFAVSGDGRTGTSLYPQSPYLAGLKLGPFLDGTIAPSRVGALPDVVKLGTKPYPPDLPKGEGALDVHLKGGKVNHSVRGVLAAAGLLYACDEPGGVVRVYAAPGGTPVLKSTAVGSPVQLLLAGGRVYVAAGEQVYSAPALTSAAAGQSWELTPVPLSPAPGGVVSGIAFDGQGNLNVALREARQVRRYAPDFSALPPWGAGLPDNPEFLLYVPG